MNESLEFVIKESDDGIFLNCWIQPKASKNKICGLYNGALKIQIAAPPEKGKANSELCGFIAKFMRISKSNVFITRGELSRNKTVLIRGMSKQEFLKQCSI